jgi:hypothetical protein
MTPAQWDKTIACLAVIGLLGLLIANFIGVM